MRKIEYDGIKAYYPETANELKRLFLAHGIPVTLTKTLGRYDLVYSDKTMVITRQGRIGGMTLRQWIDFAMKHKPKDLPLGEKGSLHWDMVVKVNKSTL